mmetsp:Transcript_65033/g.121145  ORF Transcript_65033/g.121145 Transcript_65033/m.121145 type:complete len:230 (+) Transcript_65033:717-1406(+)
MRLREHGSTVHTALWPPLCCRSGLPELHFHPLPSQPANAYQTMLHWWALPPVVARAFAHGWRMHLERAGGSAVQWKRRQLRSSARKHDHSLHLHTIGAVAATLANPAASLPCQRSLLRNAGRFPRLSSPLSHAKLLCCRSPRTSLCLLSCRLESLARTKVSLVLVLLAVAMPVLTAPGAADPSLATLAPQSRTPPDTSFSSSPSHPLRTNEPREQPECDGVAHRHLDQA